MLPITAPPNKTNTPVRTSYPAVTHSGISTNAYGGSSSHDPYTVPINANTNNNIKINFLPLNFRKRAPTPASMAPAKFNIAKNAPDIRIEKLTSAPFANPLIGAINTSQIPTGAVPVPLTTSPFSSNDAL